jgi:hypothetical protein
MTLKEREYVTFVLNRGLIWLVKNKILQNYELEKKKIKKFLFLFYFIF